MAGIIRKICLNFTGKKCVCICLPFFLLLVVAATAKILMNMNYCYVKTVRWYHLVFALFHRSTTIKAYIHIPFLVVFFCSCHNWFNCFQRIWLSTFIHITNAAIMRQDFNLSIHCCKNEYTWLVITSECAHIHTKLIKTREGRILRRKQQNSA